MLNFEAIGFLSQIDVSEWFAKNFISSIVVPRFSDLQDGLATVNINSYKITLNAHIECMFNLTTLNAL